MIGDQAVRMDIHLIRSQVFPKLLQKKRIVLWLKEYSPLVIASVIDVIEFVWGEGELSVGHIRFPCWIREKIPGISKIPGIC